MRIGAATGHRHGSAGGSDASRGDETSSLPVSGIATDDGPSAADAGEPVATSASTTIAGMDEARRAARRRRAVRAFMIR
ncbi:hypothetical protein ASD23_09085 [Agromyces sp. Root1464]|nr:hypothetical protein ASD23_09085 [Agromyces sp. Root1464]